jgi:hypothetical protein
LKSTAYHGFLTKGPGAKVEIVPVEKDWAQMYACHHGPSIKLTE